jgi:peptidoglycan/xylan/chitin deacetylase (PgdA/CDA1 family)
MLNQTRHREVPHGLMFHHFHGGRIPISEGSLGAGQFRDILNYIGLERIWRAEEWLRSAMDGTLPGDAVCVTLDDGLYSQFEIAWPVLRELNLTAFWFPHTIALSGTCDQLELYRYIRNYCFDNISEFYGVFEQRARENWDSDIENGLAKFRYEEYFKECSFFSVADKRFRYLRDEVLGPVRYASIMEQLRTEVGVQPEMVSEKLFIRRDDWQTLIQDGNVIGLHSHTHPTRMEDLPLQEQEREYSCNYSVLMDKLQYRPESVAHPCGSFTETTLGVLRSLGVRIGFAANMCRPEGRDLEYPRQNHANILMEMTGSVAAEKSLRTL